MASDPDIQDGLATVADCIEKGDRETLEKIDAETEDGDPLHGFVFTHGDENLAVAAPPESHYFRLEYGYDVTREVAIAQQVQEKAPDLPNDPSGPVEIEIEGELDETNIQSARRRVATINANRDAEKQKKVKSKLMQMLSDPNCGFRILNELNGPHGFELNEKLFVYESAFRPSEFDSACQTLVSVGTYPKQFLQRVFNIEINLGGGDAGDKSQTMSPGSRGFQ
jgi:hypothetical protein